MQHLNNDRRPGVGKQRTIITAAAVAVGLVLSGCASGDSSDPNAPITLKVSTFGASGSLESLLPAFEKDHPNIKVEMNTAASEADARTNMFTKLAAGNGLADVEQTEIAWTGELKEYSDLFLPVENNEGGDWVSYQSDPATTDDGELFAYGVGVGPEAVCYRSDLFDAVGLPSDPESVASMLGDSWEDYFAAGEQYKAAGGEAGWFDSASSIYEARAGQLEFPYESEDGDVVADNADVEDIFKDTMTVSPALSAKLAPFSEDWNAGMASGSFATMMCPSWMLEVIQGNSTGVTGWRIANTFPGGGGNAGGSFFVVPTQTKHPKEAAELAAWLTAPEQQIAAFKGGSAFPSRLDALDSPELLSVVNPFFGDAPVGEIFADRTKAITTTMYQGPKFSPIATSIYDATQRVETGQQSTDEAWEQFVSELNDLN
jgi:cellobiose transport system substrate-binding protein